jgi:peroxiredoxin
MEAYRDQYATLFNNGRKVVVVGISVDPDTVLANWARESDFPILFASDADASVSKQYQVYNEQSKADARHVYVISPDGHVAFKMAFRVLVAGDYDTLHAEVDKLSPLKKEGSF